MGDKGRENTGPRNSNVVYLEAQRDQINRLAYSKTKWRCLQVRFNAWLGVTWLRFAEARVASSDYLVRSD